MLLFNVLYKPKSRRPSMPSCSTNEPSIMTYAKAKEQAMLLYTPNNPTGVCPISKEWGQTADGWTVVYWKHCSDPSLVEWIIPKPIGEH